MVRHDFITEFFPKILNYHLTATVEREGDNMADGEKVGNSIMQ